MWIFDWIKGKRKKKAFRIIRSTKSYTTLQPLYLEFPNHHSVVKIQKTIYEKVVERQQKSIQIMKLLPNQSIHFHTHIIHNKVVRRPYFRMTRHMNDLLKEQVKQMYHQSVLEEQEYFRTRPTLARTTLQRMLLGQTTYVTRKNVQFQPLHLEILKNSVPQDIPSSPKEIEQKNPIWTPKLSQYVVSAIVQEVKKQLQKEMWRKGGDKAW